MKYVIFLVDADRLFDTALGMYDFSLVLMVAQHAQKVIPFRLNDRICLTVLVSGPERISPIPARTEGPPSILSAL